MKIYAHWLDGAYRQAMTRITVQRPWSPLDDQSIRLIKTLALFGDCFVLSDVQLVDSPVLWKLFSDPDFRRFLTKNPEFLQLIARPITPHSDKKWSVAVAGLERAIRAGFIASPLADKTSIVSLSAEILAGGPVSDLDAFLAKRTKSPDFSALQGFTEAVRFFTSTPARVAEPPFNRLPHTFYSILEDALRNEALIEPDRRQLKDALTLVSELVDDPGERTRRAAVLKKLDFSNPSHVSSWRTIVQAWNVAAQRSVCETGGAIGNMPGAVPVAAYVDEPVDVMLSAVPEKIPEARKRLYRVVPEIPFAWDPGELSWADLDRMIDHDHIADARSELQRAVLLDDEQDTTEAVRQFANAVAPKVPGRLKPPVPGWIWKIGRAFLIFGTPETKMLGAGIFAAEVGEQGLVWAINRFRDRMIAARVRESAAVRGK